MASYNLHISFRYQVKPYVYGTTTQDSLDELEERLYSQMSTSNWAAASLYCRFEAITWSCSTAETVIP